MSRIQVVKPHASAYTNFHVGTRKHTTESNPSQPVVTIEQSPPSADRQLLAELKEATRLNESLRTELQHVIRFNVALQQEIDAMNANKPERILSTSTSTSLVHRIVPTTDCVLIGPFTLSKHQTYVIETHVTCINIDIVDDCGTVLALYEQGYENILGTGAAAWNGRVNADDDNPYGGVHTVIIRALFTPGETKEYSFELKEIGKKHTQLLLNHPTFPCITTIL
jgi:hypothetical protein